MHGESGINARLKAVAPAGNLANADEVRRVCLAFESVEVGQHMLAWATKYCLFPDDEVYIVHCFSKVRGWRCGTPLSPSLHMESVMLTHFRCAVNVHGTYKPKP